MAEPAHTAVLEWCAHSITNLCKTSPASCALVQNSLLHNLVEPMDVGKYCPYCRPSYALMIASRATSSSSLYILTLIPISLIMFFMVLAITKSPNRLLNAENTISTSHRRP